MAGPSTTVTVDRISNSGNPIAQQQHQNKCIHVPAAEELGETLEVKLVDKGGYFEARLVDRVNEVQPRGPSASPDTSDIASDLLDPSSDDSHNFEVRSSITSDTTGEELRQWVATRKM